MNRRELMKGAAATAVAVALPANYPRKLDMLVTAMHWEYTTPYERDHLVFLRRHEDANVDAAWYRCL